jgi:hypothetical protein
LAPGRQDKQNLARRPSRLAGYNSAFPTLYLLFVSTIIVLYMAKKNALTGRICRRELNPLFVNNIRVILIPLLGTPNF